jgi:glycosyltransferase involved in cell wall biosynthesis
MRILVVCSDTGVRIGHGKGASLHLRAITHAFATLGHQVEVVGIASSAPADLDWAVPVHAVPHPGRAEGLERELRKLTATAAVSRRARAVADRLRPDMIYERLALFGTAGMDVAADSGAVHVLEINALLTAEESTWRGLQLAQRAREIEARVLRTADLRVAVSDEVFDAIVPYAAGGPGVTVPNGVDLELFSACHDRDHARAAFGLPERAAILGFTGSIRPWHGLDIAITALSQLPEHVHIAVAGTGPVQDELRQRAAELGVGHRLHWLGQLDHQHIPRMLAACDVALAPYPQLPNFGFSPLKLYEYLAAGVPVVASDIGQIRTALGHGRWGRLVAPGDAQALAAAVSAELHELERARVRAAAAREFALSRHGWTGRATQILIAAGGLRPGRTPNPNRGHDALAS